MKYNVSWNTKYRQGVGEVPGSWFETALEDHKDVVELHFYRHIQVWDWDECFDEEHDFLFEDDKAFRLYYSGWAEWYHEDDEKNGLKSEWHVEEISPSEANVPNKNKRDYI